mgnify:CR=1 FL=1
MLGVVELSKTKGTGRNHIHKAMVAIQKSCEHVAPAISGVPPYMPPISVVVSLKLLGGILEQAEEISLTD